MAYSKRAGPQQSKAGNKAAPKQNRKVERTASAQTAASNASDDDYADSDDVLESQDGSDDSIGGLEEARLALKALQAAMERAEKRDGFAKKFEAEVREDEKRLLETLDAEQKKIQAEEEQFKSRFESLFRSALAPPSVMPKDIETSEEIPSMQTVGLEEQPLYRMTKDTLERSHKLLEVFNKLNDHASSIKPLPDLSEKWEKDHAEVQRLIKVGSEVSAEKIERLITYENPENLLRNSISQWRRKRKRGVEDDENLKNMLDLGKADGEGGSRVGGRRGWGLVAHQVQKGFEALVEALPEERERC
ncbi:hypothetical protein LOZ58_005230 [Ophidiomyces ophidiicola]|nr:hypothetical protein LOZ58_005230 [Ophidiomyces ophidiicola]